jgi:D-3-phosphoglycerate dehydrogenase
VREKQLASDHISVAVLGARFGALTIEAEELAPLGVRIVEGAGATAEEIARIAGKSAAILAGSGPKFGHDVLAQLANCRAIVRYGVGTETIDLPAATEMGILVANVPEYCVEEVATHTFALILACVRKLLPGYRDAIAGRWEVVGVRPLISTENQVLGLVGLGRIGQAVARKAQAFGFQILVFDPYLSAEKANELGATLVELDTLLSRADVISLHSPDTPETHHIISAATLSRMKPTAFLVNASRGGLVDESALLEALNRGRIAGAALDVLESEPVPADHPLLKSERCLVTPHMAWYSEQSIERMRRLASREVARVLNGQQPVNLVNPKVVETLSSQSRTP